MIHDNPRIAEAVRLYHGTVNPAQGKLPKGSLFINISTGKVYFEDGTALSEIATSASTDAAAAAAVGTFIAKGGSLPAKADFIGQLFVIEGAQSGNGLYVATGTTTPGWKTVSHAS